MDFQIFELHFQPGTYLDQKEKHIRYRDFVNKELILFSMADLQRSIPSVVDGLKPGQRKILFCSFKRNFFKEAKVAQFSGYVSEHSAYHHGEQSLASTIVGMAQDYVGSNNINLLQPNGQFGTRHQVSLVGNRRKEGNRKGNCSFVWLLVWYEKERTKSLKGK